MDHNAMRTAYLNALALNTVDFKLHQCNSCGADNDGIGEYMTIQSYTQILKIWECQKCLSISKG
jgi:ribosomal protein L37AE/L43A